MTVVENRKTIAYIVIDTESSALGLHSYAADPLAGEPVLARTVSRLKQMKMLDDIIVFCPKQQEPQLTDLLKSYQPTIHGLNDSIPASGYIRRRKWALNSWRGGLKEATVFDEQQLTCEMVRFLRDQNVYVAMPVRPEAVLLDPALADDMLAHHHQNSDEMRFTFSHAAPGLIPSAFRLDLLHETSMVNVRIGDVLAYDPEQPHVDYINEPCCFEVPLPLTCSPFRYLADTRRSMDLFEKALNNGLASANPSAIAAIAAMEHYIDDPGSLPRELEIEITTEPSLRIKGYPHCQGLGRGPMSLDQFKKIITDCRNYDDLLLTISGFGEPLTHPDLMTMIHTAKEAGIFGIHIESDGLNLSGPLADQLAQSPADLISIWLDADCAQVYEQVKGRKGFDQVITNIETFIEKSKQHNGPMIVPHLVKTPDTMAEMEPFYDRWLMACKAAVIIGYNDFAGQIDDHAVTDMRPPARTPCSRLWKTMTILADGTATACSQDFKGIASVGNAFEKTVPNLWQGDELGRLRQEHKQEQYEKRMLCSRCKEWHR